MIHNRKIRGVYSVEFAIVASLFFILFFAVLEFGRLFYTWNVLTEVARRGARLVTVCHIIRDSGSGDIIPPAIPAGGVLSVATFSDYALIPNLTSANIDISYLTFAGTTATTFSDIRLVRGAIKDYQHQLLIPFYTITLNSPSFSSTLPRESLGVTKEMFTTCS